VFSLDGYGASPIKVATILWAEAARTYTNGFYPTRPFRRMSGKDEGTTGIDGNFAAKPALLPRRTSRPPAAYFARASAA
jgi:hypothetical protein